MKKIILGASAALLLAAPPAFAHRVHLFAYASNGALLADCRFAKNRPARNAEIIVYDVKSGRVLLRGKSDEKGAAKIPLTPELLKNPVDLRLVLNAGEGHQGEWEIAASTLQGQNANADAAAATEKAPVTPSALQEAAPANAPTPESPAPAASTANAASQAELEAIINRALDTRLAPIQTMLAAQMAEKNASGPGFRDIFGGLGWIAGIFGIAAWFSARRKRE